MTATVTFNLNKIIDVNHYPMETAKTSNLRHRPIGIGVQGLADAFILLGMPFDSPEVNFFGLLNQPFKPALFSGLSSFFFFGIISGSATEQRHI